MNLDKVAAEIRPRGRWESIDLGCAIVRKNFGKIMLAWVLLVWPVWIILIFLLGFICDGSTHANWVAFLCWLSVPIMGRVPLYILSRALFSENVNLLELAKVWPKMIFRRPLKAMIFSRMTGDRGLSEPVAELEGLKGLQYRNRLNLLSRNGGDGAVQAMMVSLLLVGVVTLSLSLFLETFLALFGESDLVMEAFSSQPTEENQLMGQWVWIGLFLMALSLIEPFFVGAGFAMYINSRTVTEGWDIELAFKRLSGRIHDTFGKVGSLLLITGLFLGGSLMSSVEAADTSNRVEKIMDHEDFIVHQETYEEEVASSSSSSSSSGYSSSSGSLSAMSGIGQLLFWVIIFAAIAGLVWIIYANRHVLQKGRSLNSEKNVEEEPKLKKVMGMDVRPESLPKDIVTKAREAWSAGEQKWAMHLLYRGSVSWLVNHGNVSIVESDTEHDCVRRSEREGASHIGYFQQLTGKWVNLAYGEVTPSDAEMSSLLDRWPFGNQRGGAE